MNHIYKVIWNKTTQSLVVVSELAASRSKTKSSKRRAKKITQETIELFTKTVGTLTLGSAVLSSAPVVLTVGAAAIFKPSQAEAYVNNVSYARAANYSVAIGANTTANYTASAMGGESVAIGGRANSSGYQSLAIGTNTTASGDQSISIGSDVHATGYSSIAIGSDDLDQIAGRTIAGYYVPTGYTATHAAAAGAIVLGARSVASGRLSTILGSLSTASADGATVLGSGSNASGQSSTIVGFNSTASAANATVVGSFSVANASNAIAIGTNSTANGTGALAFGQNAISSGVNSVAMGATANATADGAIAIGDDSQATDKDALAQGKNTRASGNGSTAVGNSAKALANSSTALGNNANASQRFSTALGTGSKASESATAVGNDANASGFASFAAALNATASGYAANAIGFNSVSSGMASLAAGYNATTNGTNALAIGSSAQALANNAISIGTGNIVSGENSGAIGDPTYVTGYGTYSIGNNNGWVTGNNSGVFGNNNSLTSDETRVIGNNNTIAADNTVAMGNNITVLNSGAINSIVIGESAHTESANATAIGVSSNASAESSVSIGTNSNAVTENTTAIGNKAYAQGYNSTAIGMNASTWENNGVAIGSYANATGVSAISVGTNSIATETGSAAYGMNANASNVNALAIGTGTQAKSRDSVAIGNQSVSAEVRGVAIGTNANVASAADDGIAIGTNAVANGKQAIAAGLNASATANNTVAIGSAAKASGDSSFSGGVNSNASGDSSTAVGVNAQATKSAAVALGSEAKALSDSTIAIGNRANANAQSAVAVGENSNATGNFSTALGDTTTASGLRSVAVGIDANATATNAVAVGDSAFAGSQGALALGFGAQANSAHSVALGEGSIATAGVDTDSATVNGLTYGGFAGSHVNSTLSVGHDNQYRQIQKVAAGQVTATSTDAINGSQLYATQGVIGNVAKSVVDNFGGNAVVDGNGTVTFTNIGGTGEDNINDAIAAAKTEVKGGTNIAGVTETKGANNQTVYTVNANGTTISNGSGAVTINATSAGNNITNYAVDLSQKTKNDIQQGVDANTTVNSKGVTFAADSGTATERKLGDTLTVNGDGDLINTTASAGKLEVAATDKLKEAVTNATSALQSVVTQIDGKDVKTLNKADNKANFVSGDNISLTNDGQGGIKVATKDNVTFTTVNATTFNAGDVSISNNGINAGGKVVTNVANGTKDSDAVNLSQLNATNANVANNAQNITNNANNISNNTKAITNNTQNITTNANNIAANTAAIKQGFNIGADKGADDNVQLGETVNYNGDSNIITTVSDNAIAFALNSSIAVDNVTVNDTFKAGDVTINSAGIDAGNHTITNVTAGTNATDAVNVAQLNASQSSVKAGDNVNVTSAKDANGTVYTVNANTSTVSNGSDKVTVTKTDAGNHTSNYAVDLSQSAKDSLTKADSALQSWTAQVNGVDAKVVNQTNNTVNFVNGTNTVVSADASGNISVSTAENVTFNTVNASTFNAGDVTINNNGINAGNHTITNVANGTKDSDAVNFSQLNATNANVTNNAQNITNNTNAIANNTQNITNNTNAINKGINFGNGTSANNFALGSTINVKPSDSNLVVKTVADGVELALADSIAVSNVTVNDTFKAGDVTINSAGIDAGNHAITNVTAGTNATDAVNLGQLEKYIGDNSYNWNLSDGTNSNAVADNSTVAIKGSANADSAKTAGIVTALDGTNVSVDLSDKTKSDIQQGVNANTTVSKGFNIGADKGADDNVQLGETVNYNGDSNIITTVSNNAIAFALNSSLNLTDAGSVTMGDVVVNNGGITIANGSTNNQAVSLTKDGLNNGGNKITNVANGTQDSDAVNLAQLNASQSSVKAGDNVNVTSAKDANGTVYTVNANTSTVSNGSDKVTVTKTDAGNHTSNYAVDLSQSAKDSLTKADSALQSWTAQVNGVDAKVVNQTNNTVNFVNGTNTVVSADASGNISVSTAENVTFNTVNASTFNAGDVSISSNGINAGGKVVTNVANGTKDSDAVNLSQLNATNTNVANNAQNITNNTNAIANNTQNITNNTNAINKGINFGNGTTATKFNLGDTINVTSDSNLVVSTVTDGVKLTLADSIAVGNVTVNDTFKAGDVTINNSGIDAGNHAITNVTAGTNATDAVNVAQLNASQSSVKAGDNVNVTSAKDANGTVYTVNANTSTVSNGSDKVTVTKTDAGNHTSNYAVDLSQSAKDSLTKADSALQSLTTSADGNQAQTLNQENSNANFISGNNIQLTPSANGITVATKADVTFTNVTATNVNGNTVTIGSGANTTTLTSTAEGLDVGGDKLTNISAGTNATDAVNLGQLEKYIGDNSYNWNLSDGTTSNAVADNSTVAIKGSANADSAKTAGIVTALDGTNVSVDLSEQTKSDIQQGVNANTTVSKGFNIGADNGNDDNVQLGETVKYKGDSNIITTVSNNTIAFALNPSLNLTDAGSVTMGDVVVNNGGITIANGTTNNQTVSLTKDGLNNGGNKITNVANGTQDSDAVNLAQLNASQSSVKAGDNVNVTSAKDANGTVYTVNANTSTVSNGSDKVTVTKTDAGNHTSNYAVDLSDAAKSSLTKADSALQSLTTSADGNQAQTLNQENSNANFISGNNIQLTPSANGITVSTKADVTFTNVTATNVNGNTVTIGSGANTTTLTSTAEGLDVGGDKLTNISAGTNATDAVNVAQLEANTTRYYSVNSTATGNRKNDGATGANAMAAGANATASGDNATAIGQGTKANSAAAIAIGNNANATSSSNDSVIAIGNNAQSTGSYSIAVGTNSVASNTWSMAMGISAKATGDYATGLGSNAQATAQWTTALGAGANATESAATAVGSNATAGADGATVIGYNSSVTGANTTALGNNINVSTEGSVVLGNNSAAATATTETAATVNNLTYSGFAGAGNVTTGDYVSVGSAGQERQIKYVAPGNISATSTDAINGSQLYATNRVLGNVANSVVNNFGGNAAVDSNGNITFTDIGGTGETTIHDAIKNVSDVANTGWNVQTNGDTATKVAPGDTVQFKDGKNIKITRTEKDITVATADDVSFNSINTSTLTAGPVTINSNGIDAGNKTITNVAAGTNGTDAVNLDQLNQTISANAYNWNISDGTNKADVPDNGTVSVKGSANADSAKTAGIVTALDGTNVSVDLSEQTKSDIQQGVNANTTVSKGFNIGADKGNDDNVQLGETVKYKGDSNIITTVSNNTIAFALNSSLNLTDAGSVTMGDVVVNNGGITIANGTTNNQTVSLTKDGLNNGGNKITNVANGTQDSDAVNLAQLNASQSSVKAGDNVNVTSAKDTNGTVYTVNANTSTVSNGSDKVTVTKTNAGNHTSNYAVDLSDAAKSSLTKADSALQSWTAQVNGSTVKVVNQTNNTVNFVNGTNTVVSADASGNISVSTAENVTFNTVNASTFNAGDVSISSNGINAGGKTVTNVANGTKDSDAVNLSQLNATNTNVANNAQNITNNANNITNNTNAINKGINFGNGTKANNFALGSTINVTSDSNLVVSTVTDGVKLTLADSIAVGNVTVNDTFKAGNVTINNSGIDAGNHAITNVTAGTNATDAVNVGQLEKYVSDNAYNWNLSDGTNNSAVADNSTVAIKGSANGDSKNTAGIVTALDGTNVSVDLSEQTKSDIQQGVNANTTVSKGFNIGADKGNDDNVQLGETVKYKGDSNIITTVSNNTIAFALNPSLNLTGAGSVTMGDVVVNNGGITIANGTTNNQTVSLTKDGLNNGGNKITNVANGTAPTDAVNVSQLNEVKETANAGWNLTVNGTDSSKVKPKDTVDLANKDGNINITKSGNNVAFDLSDKLNIGSGANTVVIDGTTGKVSAGNVSIGKDGISAGGQTITNVAPGVNGTDAVNVDQLRNFTSSVVDKPLTFAGDTGTPSERKMGSTVTVKGGVSDTTKLTDNNIGVVSDGQGSLNVKLAKDLTGLNSVTISNGSASTKLTTVTKKNVEGKEASALDVGGNQITNVAPGEVSKDSTDAVNGSQLHATNQQVIRNANAINQVAGQVHSVDRKLRAGVAGALASGGLYHATMPGKSMVAAGAGTYRGESAIAVGYSRLSDNGKLGVKFSVNSNTRGDTGAAASVGYQW
ncbi:YadA-like family protein [Exercitatus varius]|uniref:YadA-like family protein n=2 Tax=Exercitatus varius TaxID=67857 RepID=UPI00294B8BC5|nr:YadA-like family protein [Exercitatus varius]MDG2944695.1 YadA-like family protein [Exercitatus varius]